VFIKEKKIQANSFFAYIPNATLLLLEGMRQDSLDAKPKYAFNFISKKI